MKTPDKTKILVWPDGSWVSEDEIDDIDWFLTSAGRGDDYAEYLIPSELDNDDIDELIQLKAFPGMLPDKINLVGKGKIEIPKGATLLVHYPKDLEYKAFFMLPGKLISNAPDMVIEVIMPKK